MSDKKTILSRGLRGLGMCLEENEQGFKEVVLGQIEMSKDKGATVSEIFIAPSQIDPLVDWLKEAKVLLTQPE